MDANVSREMPNYSRVRLSYLIFSPSRRPVDTANARLSYLYDEINLFGSFVIFFIALDFLARNRVKLLSFASARHSPRPHRSAVRTTPSHGVDRGSIPLGATILFPIPTISFKCASVHGYPCHASQLSDESLLSVSISARRSAAYAGGGASVHAARAGLAGASISRPRISISRRSLLCVHVISRSACLSSRGICSTVAMA